MSHAMRQTVPSDALRRDAVHLVPPNGPAGHRRRCQPRRRLGGLGLAALAALWGLTLGGCSLDGLLKSNELPPNVTDPAITRTPDGARAAYNGALQRFQGTGFITQTGLLSDELSGSTGGAFALTDPVSLRALAEGTASLGTDGVFDGLSGVRQQALQAIGLAGDYLPEEPALRAHLYAIQGYAEVMLAELFCSGIPLSTIDYQGDYTLRPGSTTTEVFTHAAGLFDTALALVGSDSARILNLSRVGKARALLGLGDVAGAAAAVVAVPDTFRYALHYPPYSSGGNFEGLGYYPVGGIDNWNRYGVADREGSNGLAYRSSDDPRTPVTLLSSGFYHPNKYTLTGADTVVVASGLEARLIEAEAALQAGDVGGWLDKLNALRTDGTYETPDPAGASGNTDTLWHAGTGGVARLAPLADPGSDTARVSLLFRERAFWLFLTGHRQGDLRRLVRQYHRSKATVYPVGNSQYGGVYGSYIDAPIPAEERTLNPLFTGCSARD